MQTAEAGFTPRPVDLKSFAPNPSTASFSLLWSQHPLLPGENGYGQQTRDTTDLQHILPFHPPHLVIISPSPGRPGPASCLAVIQMSGRTGARAWCLSI
jgi:hypothetical protein